MIRSTVLRHHRLLVLTLALFLSLTPILALASSHHTATRTDVAFTSTIVEVIEPVDEWADAQGGFHFRDLVQIEELTGDITGTVTITLDGDFEPAGECTEDACPGFFSVWGVVEIEGEDGGWYGTFVSISSDVPGEEFTADAVVLRGRGDNADKSIYAESVDEDETSISFEGVMSTLATPLVNFNTNVHLCADPETFAFNGGYLSAGAIEGNGAATGDFLVSGSETTYRYAVAGMLTLTDGQGSVTIALAGTVQDVITQEFFVSNFWGQYLILEGTGDYAELFGHGRMIGSAGNNTTCAAGFGIDTQLLGEAHYN